MNKAKPIRVRWQILGAVSIGMAEYGCTRCEQLCIHSVQRIVIRCGPFIRYKGIQSRSIKPRYHNKAVRHGAINCQLMKVLFQRHQYLAMKHLLPDYLELLLQICNLALLERPMGFSAPSEDLSSGYSLATNGYIALLSTTQYEQQQKCWGEAKSAAF